jgi:DNA-binding transcriptional ArsR family regulator
MLKSVFLHILKNQKKDFYFTIFHLLNKGINPTKISEELGISKQKVNYYLSSLKKERYIKKVGYGTWEILREYKPKQVKIVTSNTLPKTSKNSVRGHGFIWIVKIPKQLGNLKERAKRLEHKSLSRGQLRIYIKNRKVWIGNKTIVIYENNNFYGHNAIESKKYAVFGLIQLLEALENKLQINLKPYCFKPKREHYGLIKNELAIQCNDKKEKIYIRDDLEGEWLWIDNSLGLGELETGGTKALTRNVQVQNWFNDMKQTNFKVTPSFLLEAINKVTSNQVIFDKNFSSHLKVLNKLSKAVDELREEIKRKDTTK